MKPAYLPGPWTLKNIFVNNAPNRAIVTQNYWGAPTLADCGEATPENLANARLISKAPALVEELELLVHQAAAFQESEGDAVEDARLTAVLDSARALLNRIKEVP